MTYDSNISREVSLSKVLDEMIIDGTSIEIIVQFLKSHESCVKDIFSNSVFAYDLYDVNVSGSFPHHELEKYICCLHPISLFFVLTSCVDLALELELPSVRKKYAHIMSQCQDCKGYLLSYSGLQMDREALASGVDFIGYLDRIAQHGVECNWTVSWRSLT